MAKHFLSVFLLLATILVNAQQLILMDRMNGNKIVNDSTITISSADSQIIDLTVQFTMKNNTDKLLSLNLRKTVNYMADSTIDYFCFGVQCWPETDTTNYPDTIQAGAEDYTFASHVVHFRRFEMPPLPIGKSSITYTIYDDTSYPETIEANVTVIYDHRNELGLMENNMAEALVYPNPVNSHITIAVDDRMKGQSKVNIYNNQGRLVKSMSQVIKDDKIMIPVEELNAGYYIGHIENATSEPLLFRFIK